MSAGDDARSAGGVPDLANLLGRIGSVAGRERGHGAPEASSAGGAASGGSAGGDPRLAGLLSALGRLQQIDRRDVPAGVDLDGILGRVRALGGGSAQGDPAAEG